MSQSENGRSSGVNEWGEFGSFAVGVLIVMLVQPYRDGGTGVVEIKDVWAKFAFVVALVLVVLRLSKRDERGFLHYLGWFGDGVLFSFALAGAIIGFDVLSPKHAVETALVLSLVVGVLACAAPWWRWRQTREKAEN